MEKLRIFSATLGLSKPWKVTSVEFPAGSNRMEISVELTHSNALICPICGARGIIEAAESQTETWCHDDFLCYITYLHALIPPILCNCGSFPLERPWCREGSRFFRVP